MKRLGLVAVLALLAFPSTATAGGTVSGATHAAVTRASENLSADDLPPLPERLTPHSLRRTFCSLLYALGEDPGVVMDEMGHTNPALALRVYRQAMRRGEGEKTQLRALVEGEETGVETQRFVLDPKAVACASDASASAPV
jgi:integrase